MTDRELLEFAAEAYWGDEIDDVCSVRWLDKDECIGFTHGDNQDHNGLDVEWCWNPLTDDGDALRLAVTVKMSVTIFDDAIGIGIKDWGYQEFEIGNEPYAATRRAIVRAAAEIGKQA
jgi:hypothetical protein